MLVFGSFMYFYSMGLISLTMFYRNSKSRVMPLCFQSDSNWLILIILWTSVSSLHVQNFDYVIAMKWSYSETKFPPNLIYDGKTLSKWILVGNSCSISSWQSWPVAQYGTIRNIIYKIFIGWFIPFHQISMWCLIVIFWVAFRWSIRIAAW